MEKLILRFLTKILDCDGSSYKSVFQITAIVTPASTKWASSCNIIINYNLI